MTTTPTNERTPILVWASVRWACLRPPGWPSGSLCAARSQIPSRRSSEPPAASPSRSPRAAAEGAAAVLLAVRNQEQLEESLYGEDGVVPVLRPGVLVVLTSTVAMVPVREVAQRLGDEGLHLVDAPVSGGPARAGTGEFLIMLGASNEAYAAAAPLLEQLASTLQLMGARSGDGQARKTVDQLLRAARRRRSRGPRARPGAGSRPGRGTTYPRGRCGGLVYARGPRMLEADAEGAEVRSRLDIFVKDMGIVTGAARSVGLATPVTSSAQQLYLLGQAQVLADRDDSAVIQVIAPRTT